MPEKGPTGYYYPSHHKEVKEERSMLKPIGVRRFRRPRLFGCGHRSVLGNTQIDQCFECVLAERRQAKEAREGAPA